MVRLFFSSDPDDQARAKAICSTCSERQDCLTGAIERREPAGIWGGLEFPTEYRRAMRVSQRAQQLAEEAA